MQCDWLSGLLVGFQDLLFRGIVTVGMAFGGISDLKCKVEVGKGSCSAFLGWGNVVDVSFES